jgi:hypothetical protein
VRGGDGLGHGGVGAGSFSSGRTWRRRGNESNVATESVVGGSGESSGLLAGVPPLVVFR